MAENRESKSAPSDDGVNADSASVDRVPDTAHFRSARGLSMPFWIALILVVLGSVVFLLSASALFVFGIGVAIAYFLVPVVNWFERRGLARWVAAILLVVVTLLAIILLLGAMALIVVEQGVDFVRRLPDMLDELAAWYESVDLPEWLRAGIDTIIASIEDNLRGVDQGVVVAGLIGNLLSMLGGLFAWFLLPSSSSTCSRTSPGCRVASTLVSRRRGRMTSARP